MLKPRLLLHIEGAVVLFAACVLYHVVHGSWLWFGLLLLTPDLSMLGYLAGKGLGAALYNLAHNYAIPLLLFVIFWAWNPYPSLMLIWLAHIGMDRMLGFGLKYATGFKDTHLQRV